MRYLVLFFFLVAGPCRAESRSIYHISSVDIPILAGSSLAVILPYALGSQLINKRCPCDPNEIPGFDRGVVGNSSKTAATLSDLGVALSLSTPVLLDYVDLGWSRELKEDLVVFAETIAISSGLVTVVKTVVQRPIPRSYAGDSEAMSSVEGYRSFYSGHTVVAFSALTAAAMTYQYRRGFHIVPWLTTVALGTGVALGRLEAGVHFPSDVVLGAAMGTAAGFLVPMLHHSVPTVVGHLSLLPVENGARLYFRADL